MSGAKNSEKSGLNDNYFELCCGFNIFNLFVVKPKALCVFRFIMLIF